MNETGNNNNELTHNLAIAINSVSAENGSDTPDFILAELLANVLDAYNKAIRKREEWYRESTRALVVEALVAASMCGESPERAGVFLSDQAARIADALMSAMNTPGGTLGLDDHIVEAQEMVGEDQK